MIMQFHCHISICCRLLAQMLPFMVIKKKLAEQSDLLSWKLILKCLCASFETNCPPQTNMHALRLTLATEITAFLALFVVISLCSSTSQQ